MHALIENGAVKAYPYSLAQLKKACRNVSFPRNASDEALQQFGMFRVFFTAQPELTNTQVLEEDQPIFSSEDQRWTQVWRVRDMTAEEVQQRDDNKASEIRNERDEKLVESDWTQLEDAPVSKIAWATYRQALRDVPEQTGFPWEVTWPTKPE
jgi:hypothetical protein